jgi:DNA-binding LacI/PurR family transcriptional regulator
MARRSSSHVNLAAIAKRLDISVSTASRALRNAEGIHPETRRRVMAMAGELGYVMTGLQNLEVQTRPHQILAMTQCVSRGSDQGYLSGMSRASVAMNLAILSHHVAPDECHHILDHDRQPVAMRAGMVEGVVLIHRWPLEVATVLAERIPTVSIVHQYPGAQIDHVGVDDRLGVGQLVHHLVAGGHRKIGFYGFCPQVSWSRSRLAAYVESVMSEGLSFEKSHVVEIPLDTALQVEEFPMGGPDRARLLKCHAKGVTAWIAASSTTGSSLVRFFLEAGIRIPEEVAIASCHQAEHRGHQLPKITAVGIAPEELGASALRRLIHRMQHSGETIRSTLI